MNNIKCPHCGTVFTINETEYSQLLAQVRSSEFDKEIHERLEKEKALLEEKSKNDLQVQASAKDKEIADLTTQLEQLKQSLELDNQCQLAKKDQEILKLKSSLENFQSNKDLELTKALTEKDKAVASVEKERDDVKSKLALQEKEAELSLASVKRDYEAQLKAANEQVEFYKNFKAQQSTKAIGESLEVYAETEFNKVRAYAFPNATFGKDNEVSSRGSKGDFIYRETDENGIEILSIMFEIKTKHKNKDFYKELDKDRREKNCEYAVLVTMLEADNDYFNTGIVDVSHEYEKMYVVRPQLFIQLIGILRNAALNSLKYKQELALVREQNIDITHFEDDLETFKNAFAKNYNSASNNFKKAIDEIDKSIRRMEEVKRFLTTSENQLRLANNKLDDVSVKKLTRKNPTMRAKFEALKD